jgi:5-carboxyvanillate decarboxylase
VPADKAGTPFFFPRQDILVWSARFMDRRSFIKDATIATAVGLMNLGAPAFAKAKSYRRIACEEGFLVPEVLEANAAVGDIGIPLITADGPAAFLAESLVELGQGRLESMDAAGIDMQVMVLSAPGVQVFDPATALSLSRVANDRVSEACRANPERLAALAAIPPQAPDDAAKELERSVEKLGLKGAVINSHTNGEYLDNPRYWPIFEALQALDVPLYLHPRDPVPGINQYMNNPVVSGAAWAYAVEVGTHALRMIGAGVFDRFPNLKLVLGHMGEGLPFWMPRIDNRYRARLGPAGKAEIDLVPSEYIRRNFYVSTSGMNYEAPLAMTLETLGPDRVMFAADYPFERHAEAVDAVEGMNLDSKIKAALFEGNAVRIFRL